MLISQRLKELVGEQVTVTMSAIRDVAHGFHTQMSVQGTLQAHSTDPDAYRVVVHEDTYAYFTHMEVTSIVPYSEGRLRVFVQPR